MIQALRVWVWYSFNSRSSWLISCSIRHVASYLSDLWIFDTETYKWKEVEMRSTDRAPGYALIMSALLQDKG